MTVAKFSWNYEIIISQTGGEVLGKQLELHFLTEMDRTVHSVVQNSKEDLIGEEIAVAIQVIIDGGCVLHIIRIVRSDQRGSAR